MQDIEVGLRPSGKFQIKHESEKSNEGRPFIIMPESAEVRKQAVFAFDKETQQETQQEALQVVRQEMVDLPPVPQEVISVEVKNHAEISLYIYNSETLIKNNEFGLARAILVKALQIDPYSVTALKQLAKCYQGPSELSHQLKIYDQLVKLDFSFETYAQMGHICYKSGDGEKAKQFYFDGLALLVNESAELFEVYKNLGNLLVREGDFEAAEEYYNKAFTLNPDSDQLQVNLGTLEVQKNDFGSALERFRQAVIINSENDKAWVGLALVHHHMGDLQLARGNVEKALDINPSNRTAVHLYANWSQQDSHIDQSIERLQNYLAHTEFDKDMSLILIHQLCMKNQLELALIEVERILLWEPQHQDVIDLEAQIKSQIMGSRSGI